MVPPNRLKCEELGGVFKTFDDLAVLYPLPSFFRSPRGFRAQRRTVPGHQDTTVPGPQDPRSPEALEPWTRGTQDPGSRTCSPAAQALAVPALAAQVKSA